MRNSMSKIQFRYFKNTLLLFIFGLVSCGKATSSSKQQHSSFKNPPIAQIKTGASQLSAYLPLLKNKKIALVSNPTSIVFNKNNTPVHLVDTLLSHKVVITKVLAPEHGFRGKADAGETIKDGLDLKTNLPVISLYGKNKKPSPQVLKNVDLLVFDIQDVGARFYTYISTLAYVMEACAENNIPLLILDRPNPNGHYVDGPVLHPNYKSFIGLHPIPIVHGMTIGEYAQMVNGQHWLANGIKCKLSIIKMQHYNHQKAYSLPIKPSPNLPNDIAINLYPSLCLFEGTTISVGRGTEMQFQIYGAPKLSKNNFRFTPKPNLGAKHPKYENVLCYGEDLRLVPKLNKISLKWLIKAYQQYPDKENFFTSFFKKLAGTDLLKKQIEAGLSEKEIKASWSKDLTNFKLIRKKYLLYQ